jgi:outer membrane receptor for ferrienterochelin and colicin
MLLKLKSEELKSELPAKLPKRTFWKVAGVNITRNTNFGGSTSAISRGIKSGQSNEMLIVIDGMPINNSNTSINGLTSQSTGQGYDYGNNDMDINPDDIESVNVLRSCSISTIRLPSRKWSPNDHH